MKKLISMTLLFMIVLVFTACNPIEAMNEPVDSSSSELLLVTIPKGASTTKIASILKTNNLIKNERTFKMLSKNLDADGKMKAGDYKFSRNLSSEEIIVKLVSGQVFIETNTFTIPEGYNNKQIINFLLEKDLIEREAFEKQLSEGAFDYKFMENVDRTYNLEGFLFPDTYVIKKDASEYDIINVMLKRFNDVFLEQYYGRLEELNMDINKIITLASIIEKETVVDRERELVSSVFYNRLDINMKLESCATVQYTMDEIKAVLSFEDIAVDNPYNTYKYPGLTPGPIASPGEKSIVAALYPDDTNFLYFSVSNLGDGSQYFSKTYSEHQLAIKKSKENMSK
ncbi:MAG: endolytic transglycosylase MltG [Acidaminobacteraceae bacterium]